MGKITITLVKVRTMGEVRLVGRTATDRWNLSSLGFASLEADRGQAMVKRLRREYGEFTFRVSRGAGLVAWASEEECEVMGVGGHAVTAGHPAIVLMDAA